MGPSPLAAQSLSQSQHKESVELLDHPVVSLGDLFGSLARLSSGQ